MYGHTNIKKSSLYEHVSNSELLPR